MEHHIEDPTDDNADVYVILPNGDNYVATFYTPKNIQRLMAKDRAAGEHCNGLYFWGSGMILIERLDEQSFRAAVEDLMEWGHFEKAFEGPFQDPEE